MSDSSIKNLVQIFQHQPVIFFGAGVSLNSGIPIVHGGSDYEGIVDNILRHLGASESYIQTVVDRGMPFEAFIDDLTIASSIDLLLEVFDADVPNHAHKFFAKCALKGIANTFVTTNFDKLLEKALDDAGVPYQVFSSETAFTQIDWDSEITKVIKLHGTIDQKDELGVTIQRVAQKRFSSGFREVLSHIFAENDGRHVVIFGYSCSDVFDISPTIQSFEGSSSRTVTIIEHCDGELFDKEPISQASFKNPFQGYAGRRYRGNTDLVLEELSNALGIELIERVRVFDHHWKKITEIWATTSIMSCNAILGQISYNVSDLVNACSYLKAAVKETGDSQVKFTLYLYLATALISAGEFREARGNLEKAASISTSISDHSDLAHFHLNMSELQLHENRYGEALESLKSAEKYLRQAQDTADKRQMARILANKGDAYFGIGDVKGAYEALQNARSAAQSSGDLYSQAIVLRGIAKVANLDRRYEDAISKAQHACQLWQYLGQGVFEVATMIDLGTYQHNSGEVEKALEINKEAIEKAKNSGWLRLEAIARGNLANDLIELGEFLEAEPELQFAIENTEGLLATTYQINLGLLLIRMERLGDGIELLKSSIKTLRQESAYCQRQQLRRALLNLSGAYLQSNLLNYGIEAAIESREIAKELNDIPSEVKAKLNIGIGLLESQKAKEGISELEEALLLAQVHLGGDSFEATHIQKLLIAEKKLQEFAYYIEPCQLCLWRRQYENCGWCTDEDSAAGDGRVKLPNKGWDYPYHRRAHPQRQYFTAYDVHIPELDGENPPY